MNAQKAQSGFTLLEICVAIAIFAIGVLTAMSILVPAVRWGADAKTDFTASEAALSTMEYLQAGGSLAHGIYVGNDSTNVYPYAVQSSVPSLTDNTTTSVRLEVYRRRTEVSYEDNEITKYKAPAATINNTWIVSDGADGSGNPILLFAIEVKMRRLPNT